MIKKIYKKVETMNIPLIILCKHVNKLGKIKKT